MKPFGKLSLAMLLSVVVVAGCSQDYGHVELDSTTRGTSGGLVPAIDSAVERGVRFLAERQSADGAWRSNVYAPFKEGDALTPFVLAALSALPAERVPEDTLKRAQSYLGALVVADGTIHPPKLGIAYPVYTAASILLAIEGRTDADSSRARAAWLHYLRERQLTEANGWEPADGQFGGWGYDGELPRKPPAGVPVGPLTEPNLSATVFALAALRAAGVEPSATEFQRALHFVVRCQNLSPSGEVASGFDDGGFFFVQSDAVRNKAGVGGSDQEGRERYVSYGSATADGIRALTLCGLSNSEPRVQGAWRWLAKNFSADVHPGRYPPDRQAERDSVYFYYCQSLAEALDGMNGESVPELVDRRRWAEELAAALVERQNRDGSWVNSQVEVRENDPLVATAMAMRALATCRRMLVVESQASSGATPRHDRQQPADSPAEARR